MKGVTRTRPRLSYEVHGDAGEPVMFVMGFGMRGVVWRPQVEELREEYRCCVFDNRGIGDSELGGGWPTMKTMAGDVLRVMGELGWERAHVVGVSMGGMISQEVALMAPDRVKTLTLIATHAGGVRAALPTAKGLSLFARINMGSTERRMKRLQQLLYPPEFLEAVDTGAMEQRMRDQIGRRAPREVLMRQLGAVLRHRTAGRLSRVEAPTMVVRPGRDLLIRPGQSDRLARELEGVHMVRLDGAGHGVTFQEASQLNQALRAHFSRA